MFFQQRVFHAKIGWIYHGEEVVNANTSQNMLGNGYFSRVGSKFQWYENPNLDHLKEALSGISEHRWKNRGCVGHCVKV